MIVNTLNPTYQLILHFTDNKLNFDISRIFTANKFLWNIYSLSR